MTRIRTALTALITAAAFALPAAATPPAAEADTTTETSSAPSATATQASTHTVAGHISDLSPAGANSFGVSGASVTIQDAATGYTIAYGTADSRGDYQITGVPDGDYRVHVTEYHAPYSDADTGLAPAWWGGTPFRSEARILSLTESGNGNGAGTVDVGLPQGASITGSVSTTTWFENNQKSVKTLIQNPDGTWEPAAWASADGGSFRMIGVPDAPQVVLFDNYTSGIGGGQMFSPQYWPGQPSRASATIVRPRAGEQLTGFDAVLGPWRAHFDGRISGADRFEASANMSAAAFEPGVPAVFVADGTNYPDALSAGPVAAAMGGPVLLVRPDSVPSAIAAELDRLDPKAIYVVGGPRAVQPSTFDRIASYASSTTRIGGADRFEASRALARLVTPLIPPGQGSGQSGPQIMFADARGFADALSAGAAVAGSGAVVLVDGSRNSLDAATTALLNELRPGHTWVIGGPNAIAAGLEDSIRSQGWSSQRVGGATRYEVSAALIGFFPRSNDDARVYLAVGTNFPDALSGAALASKKRYSLLITPSTCVPGAVLDRMRDYAEPNAVLLGGPASLGPGVESMQRC